MRFNRQLSLIQSVCFSFTLLLSLETQAQTTLKVSLPQQQALGIQTQTSELTDHYWSLPYTGFAKVPLNQQVQISASISGKVKQILRVHGWVEKDETLLEIESPLLLTREKDYLNTLSDAQTKQLEYQRAQKLNKTGVVSDKTLQQAKSALAKANQVKSQLRQDLLLMGMQETAIQKLEQTHKLQPPVLSVKAPVAGEVSDLTISVGQRVAADAPLMKLAQLSPISVHIQVPTNAGMDLHSGQQATIEGQQFQGQVKYISRSIDPKTQSKEVHILFANENLSLQPGTMTKVRFWQAAPSEQPFYRINRQAISELEGQSVIYTLSDQEISVIPIVPKVFNDNQMTFSAQADLAGKPIIVSSTSAIKAMFENAEQGDAE